MRDDTTSIRRRNAVGLYQQFAQERLAAGHNAKGLEQEFAAAVEISPSMWSQIKKSRPISDKLARQIEHHMKKRDHWMDEPHPELNVPDESEEHFLGVARSLWRSSNAKQKRELLRYLLAQRPD